MCTQGSHLGVARRGHRGHIELGIGGIGGHALHVHQPSTGHFSGHVKGRAGHFHRVGTREQKGEDRQARKNKAAAARGPRIAARGTGTTCLTTFFHHLSIMPDRAAQSYRCSRVPLLTCPAARLSHRSPIPPFAYPAVHDSVPVPRGPRLLRQGRRRLPARARGVLGLVVDLEEKND